MPSERDLELHNEATETIIVGVLQQADYDGDDKFVIASAIMCLLKRRGYEPQIRPCNELKDGTRV